LSHRLNIRAFLYSKALPILIMYY